MLHDRDGFVRLPNEQLIYTSPPRTTLSLQPFRSYTGNEPLSVQSSSGNIYLTNQRIIYLPAQKTKELQSFSAPLLNVYDSHVSAPFFGPNVWTALVQPVSGGGIPASLHAVQLKVSFKEGGAFDFHTNFERIKERLRDAVEISQEGRRGFRDVNMASVHLDELPAYEGPQGRTASSAPAPEGSDSRQTQDSGQEPNGPPPGYEEVQQQSVANELEERLRRSS
ncbi:hypothetical protein PHISCL_02388 [Aspergillus sclerotialis]|uniref:WW-domain ligand protein n=1 Tax=Aspergillus sclerotialis TaxID=2070753 RepID=A0A3A2ZQ58_9EURO|nr:hypothetical protein PHISCL_02388 [Aspergillus sclerotialis]